MKKLIIFCGFLAASPVLSQERFVVGYFNEWPLPAHFGRQTGAYDQALGLTLEWQAFADSKSLIDAVANGQVQIGLSVGIAPLIAAKQAGKSVQIIDIAVSYPGLENCVTRPRLDISGENLSELENIQIAVPIGTSVHFNLLKQVEALGLDPDRLDLLNMSPREATAAYMNNKVDGACAWGSSLEALEARGTVLFQEMASEGAGVGMFDAVIAEDFYAQANQEKVVSFLRVIDGITEDYATYPDPIRPYLPALVNLSSDDTSSLLNYFTFLTLDKKLSGYWMSNGVQTHLNELSEFYVSQATIDEVPDNLDALVDTRYLIALQQEIQAENSAPQQQENDPESGQENTGTLAE